MNAAVYQAKCWRRKTSLRKLFQACSLALTVLQDRHPSDQCIQYQNVKGRASARKIQEATAPTEEKISLYGPEIADQADVLTDLIH